MPEFESPLWLLALPPVLFAIWWLHRLQLDQQPLRVAALFLWDDVRHRSPGGARLARPAHPIWLLRAAIAALAIIALAQPVWRAGAGGLVAWIDDSLSMQAESAQGSRRELAVQRLIQAIEQSEHSPIVLRALGDPAASIEIERTPGWQARISDWIEARAPNEPDLPLPAEFAADYEHWLVTDAAAPGIGTWLATAPISSIINVGAPALDNAAVTRLAVRASPSSPERFSGVIEVINAGDTQAVRSLTVTADDKPLESWRLDLAPGESTQRTFDFAAGPGQVAARLDRRDALPADDGLMLELLPPLVPIAVRGRCGANLLRVLDAHGRLALGAPDPLLVVVCGDEPSPGTLPTLRIHEGRRLDQGTATVPAWSQSGSMHAGLADLFLDASWLTPIEAPIPAGEPWLYAGTRPVLISDSEAGGSLHVLFDLEQPDFGRAPEYPAFVAGLLTAIEPTATLDPVVSASRPLAASSLRPVPIAPGTSAAAQGIARSVSLQRPLIAAALLLLLLDSALLYARSRSGRLPAGADLGLRALAALGLTAILIGPAWLSARDRDLIVVWDESASMSQHDRAAVWTQLASLASRLSDASRLSLIRFASETAIDANQSTEAMAQLGRGIVPAAGPAIDSSASELAPALKSAFRLIEPGRPAAVALVTDGHVDMRAAGAMLTRAAASGLPVYSLGRAEEPDVSMRIHAPRHALAGRSVPIDVTLEAREEVHGQLSLLLDDAVATAVDVDLPAGLATAIRFELVSPPGTPVYQINWRDAGGALARADVLDVAGARPWLALSPDPAGPGIQALQTAGWQLNSIRPENLMALADRLDRFAGIVLDDLAIWDLPTSGWTRIARQIEEQGSALLVLGGPRSFGAGGYRRSMLEDLLPVTAEARDPRETTAVVFALDVSGSMGRSLTEGDPLGYARRAILETASTLGDNDEVGLIAFDVAADVALPLGFHADLTSTLQSSFTTLGPDGGTRLRPALEAALDAFATTDISRRLLVLVTDGFLEDEEIASQLLALEAAGVELIALAVGRDADRLALREIVDDDALFRVERVTELPRLMRSEVERRRQPMQAGPTPVRRVNDIPAVQDIEMPASVGGHMVTLARPSATVYLETTSGDPLLAAHYAGAGRVAVLPAGLGAWAESWTSAPSWPMLGTAIRRWLAGNADVLTRMVVDDAGSDLSVTIDALDPDGSWADAAAIPLTVVDPLGQTSGRELRRIAPGRYAGAIDGRTPGRYLLTVQHDVLGARQPYFRSAARELDSVHTASALPDWLATGLLQSVPDRAAGWQFSAGPASERSSSVLLTLSISAYLVALLVPYGQAAPAALLRRLRRAHPPGGLGEDHDAGVRA